MYAIKSNEIVYRCFPEELTATALAEVEAAATANSGTITELPTSSNPSDNGSWPTRFMSDVFTLRGYIFGFGLGVSVLVAFLYPYILRLPGFLFITIWSCVLSILILLIVGTVLLWETRTRWEDEGIKSDAEITAIQVCCEFIIF